MNLTQQEGIELVRRLLALLRDQVYERVDVAVLPPFTHIRSVQALTADDPRLTYGGQDLSPYDAGAYTGDISGPMLSGQRTAGTHVPHCLGQLDHDLAGLTADQIVNVVIAYEPVWAIGTGQVATSADAQQVCHALRTRLAETVGPATAQAVRILYGGSVKAAKVGELAGQLDIDGALVGGASLDVDDFARLCNITASVAVV